MEVQLLRAAALIWSVMGVLLIAPAAVSSAPISVDFNVCVPSTYPQNPINISGPIITEVCCPLIPTKPIIDGPPPLSTSEIRVRKAAQCQDAGYAAKLNKAYELMRALPDDDPRSFRQQWTLHCAYCGGAFLTYNSSGAPLGIDIHFSWLFYPWHRWYLYFHERILQSLLGDPTFSLTYWNWDGAFTVGDGSSTDGSCLKQGQEFPSLFADPSLPTYDVNRSLNAKGQGQLPFVDFFYFPALPEALQANNSASAEALTQQNRNIMYQSMVSGGTTTLSFMGREYRAGDVKGFAAPLGPDGQSTGGAGTLETSVHSAVHFWTGGDPPSLDDMGALGHSSRDPVFYAHHGNIDRMFSVWKDIGPLLNQTREYYSDPDFLDATFLFYDENKDLRRVKVGDALDTKKLGYVYQAANDAAWIYPQVASCSSLSYLELVARAESLPVPRKSHGYYKLVAGKPFVLVIDRPENPQEVEEFLTIDGIKLDKSCNSGFDVYINLLSPSDYSYPASCGEYSGRFTNMARSQYSSKSLVWTQSATRTFADIGAQAAPSKVVITIVPLSKVGGYESIKFKSVTIST